MESNIDNLRGEERKPKEVAAKSELRRCVAGKRDYIPGHLTKPLAQRLYMVDE